MSEEGGGAVEVKVIGKCPKCGTRYMPAPGYEHDNSVQITRCDCWRSGRLEHGQGAQGQMSARDTRESWLEFRKSLPTPWNQWYPPDCIGNYILDKPSV